MTTHYAIQQRRDDVVGIALGPISESHMARMAVRIAGGGFSEEQTANAMEINRDMLAGTWRRDSREGYQAIAKA